MLEWLKDNGNDIGTVLLVIIMGILSASGLAKGKKKEEPKLVELAGAVIDGTDARAIVVAVNTNTAAVNENTAARSRGDMSISSQIDETNGRLERINEKLIEAIVMMRRGL